MPPAAAHAVNDSSAAASARRRIFVVDDHPLVRESLVALIDRQPDLLVRGQAADSAGAFAALLRESADVVVADLSLPGESGLELIKKLQSLSPVPRILVVSMHAEDAYAERALRAGARTHCSRKRVIKANAKKSPTAETMNISVCASMGRSMISLCRVPRRARGCGRSQHLRRVVSLP